jgi:superfamily II DNA or RNA helicase
MTEESNLNEESSQEDFNLSQVEVLNFAHPLYYLNEKQPIGILSKLALAAGDWEFDAVHVDGDSYELTHTSGLCFQAKLKSGRGKAKGTYQINGNVQSKTEESSSYVIKAAINGTGESGKALRRAQVGATYALMAHWSLTREVATVVLPTGTGKTETMLVATLADHAERTLVIVPSVDLKRQIAGKFACWGLLRELGVIPTNSPNPTVLMLNKTLCDSADIEVIKRADVVISTPSLLARADTVVRSALSELFSHVYFDEAHHVKASEWDLLKRLLGGSKIVQFTATPYRNDRKPIEGKVVYNYPLSQAIEDDCFSRISLISVEERNPRKKDRAIAEAAMEKLLDDRAKGWTRHRMMVRAESRAHAEVLYTSYRKWYPSERIVLVHSGSKDRKAIVEMIRDGQFDIVVCVDMLKEGFDYPDFKIAAVHGVHKTLAVLLQFIGRFTRREPGLGDASFIVNYAEEAMSVELESLFQEGSGWEKVISEIADAKKAEAESLLTFLQGCEPYLGFDSPNTDLNPKLIYPALSCVCFRAESVDWRSFVCAFNLKKYALSQPFINPQENVFYFTTQKREKVKWARTEKMRDQTWDLIVMHHDPDTELLYIGYSEKRLDLYSLVENITGSTPLPINGDNVFRSFDSIKRLSIVHAGVFKPANHLHRYSRLSGADVTTELSRWKEGSRCQKSDFVGVGFRDGFPVSVGASVKGKIWSPARVGDLKEWKEWCLNIGRLITDESIDSNQLLEDSAEKTELSHYPESLVVLATDWSEELYERIHKLTLEGANGQSWLLNECTLVNQSCNGDRAEFLLQIPSDTISFTIVLGGENGHSILGLDESTVQVEGLKSAGVPLKQFFQENPPTMFLLNGCTISGCIHTDYGESLLQQLPDNQIESLGWEGVDFTVESLYKSNIRRDGSIQEYMMDRLEGKGARIVFNDDNAGESADIVAVFISEELIRFEMVHCKYSKSESGARLSDLYEVCGQAIVSLRYKWRPEELLKHMERRNGMGILKGKRFHTGSQFDIDEIRKALKYTNVEFEFAIAQPGVNHSKMTQDMINFLGSTNSTVVEMTETRLRCYFSN